MSTSSASSTSSNHSSSSSSSPNTTSAGTPLLLSNREVDWKRDVLVTTTPGDHPTMSPEDGFYASVISNCAQKLLEQNITTMNQLFIPAHRVFGIVQGQRKGKFLAIKTTNNNGVLYSVLDKKTVIEKLVQDLHASMIQIQMKLPLPLPRDTPAAAVLEPPRMVKAPPKQTTKSTHTKAGSDKKPAPATTTITCENKQLLYAIKLIVSVWEGVNAGKSQWEAAQLLDMPNEKDETPRQERLRLLLRHRLLSVSQTQTGFLEFSQTLLKAWGVDVQSMNSVTRPVTTAHEPHGLPPSLLLKKATKKKQREPPSEPRRTWTLPERLSFLKMCQSLPCKEWPKNSHKIPTRNHRQVTAYGRYLAKKFSLGRNDLPSADCQQYLAMKDVKQFAKSRQLVAPRTNTTNQHRQQPMWTAPLHDKAN